MCSCREHSLPCLSGVFTDKAVDSMPTRPMELGSVNGMLIVDGVAPVRRSHPLDIKVPDSHTTNGADCSSYNDGSATNRPPQAMPANDALQQAYWEYIHRGRGETICLRSWHERELLLIQFLFYVC
jgi:hypothetical protein